MELNIEKLKEEASTLNQLIQDYEKVYLNIYNEIKDTSNNWIDTNSKKFQDAALLDKLKISQNINNLKELNNIYNLIILKYQNIGNNIKYNQENAEKMYNKFDDYLNTLNKILNKYKNINTSFCSEERSYINSQQDNLEKVIDNINKIKKIYIKTISNIEKIEKELNNKINKININIIKEIEITEFL